MPICPQCRKENPELGAKCPRCADSYYVYDEAAEDAENDPYIGRKAAGKYVVVAKISAGGMGTVYRALQLPVEREVAFKVLRTELEDNTEVRNRFTREARAVSKITHPNIITLHDFGFDESDYPYMVMEYAPGESLDEWIYRDDITLERIVHVMRQMLSALADAHEQGIVHRDLKPENIMVTGTGTDEDFIKLLDFGIARLVNEQATEGLTKEGEVFGTPHYMSPEQAEGETGIGTEADVYALGIMFYEMLCAETPFDAPKPLSILFKQINEDLPPIEGRPGVTVPGALGNVLRKATRKKPDQRFPDAGTMLEELKQFEDPDSSAVIAKAYLEAAEPDSPTGTLHGTGERHQPGASAEDSREMQTANTLGFEEADASDRSAEVIDTTSNDVTVEDPDHEAFDTSLTNGRRRLALVGLAAVVVGGFLLAFVVSNGGDSEPAEETAETVSTERSATESAAEKKGATASDNAEEAKVGESPEPDTGTTASADAGMRADAAMAKNDDAAEGEGPSAEETETLTATDPGGTTDERRAEEPREAETEPEKQPGSPSGGGRGSSPGNDEVQAVGAPESRRAGHDPDESSEESHQEPSESPDESESTPPEIEKFGAPTAEDDSSESTSESAPEPTKFGAPE